MSKLGVLIIEDSAFMRKALRRMIESDPALEVVGVATDGAEGVRMAAELHPGLITLDVQMPVMDGLEALRRILEHRKVPVLMLSSLTGEGADTTIRALEIGALDFIDKSSVSTSMEIVSIAPLLIRKIKDLASISEEKLGLAYAARERAIAARPVPVEVPLRQAIDLVAVGSSTGGPSCLQALLTALPADYPYPVAIVQHMPLGFTGPLAERLNSICAVEVLEAREGMPLEPGRVVIAPAGRHLLLKRSDLGLHCFLSAEPEHALHRPSADVLFASTVKAVGGRAVGVLLTGMGKDGAKGLLAMKQAGATTIAQDEASSVVWGMPRAAVELGAAGSVLSLADIRSRLIAMAKTSA